MIINVQRRMAVAEAAEDEILSGHVLEMGRISEALEEVLMLMGTTSFSVLHCVWEDRGCA